MRVTIFGTGYVGLVTGACLAQIGHDVVCVDIDVQRVDALRQGQVPIHEPQLPELIAANVAAGRLAFSTDAAPAVQRAEIVFIAVGTPSDAQGRADLRQVMACADTIGRELQRPTIVAVKSTVPVGTCRAVHVRIRAALQQRGAPIDIDVASNPEFLREGSAVSDCLHPDRIVIGATRETTLHRMRQLYAPLPHAATRVIAMDVASSELTKYACNAMLALRISFMNEIAGIVDATGGDIEQVRAGVGADPRIGPQFLRAGAGYGGSCFPKDLRALAQTAHACGRPATIVEAVEAVNERQKRRLFELICRHYGGAQRLRNKTFALWGLAFKPDTDDLRDATSLVLVEQLIEAGARVQAFDPEALRAASRLWQRHPGFVACDNAEHALHGADALVLVTEWTEFLAPDFAHLRAQLQDAALFDGRNVYDMDAVAAAGLRYYGIGRGCVERGDDQCTATPRVPERAARPRERAVALVSGARL